MSKFGPLNFEQLVDWIEGRLSAEETAVIAAEVAQAGEETKRLISWIQLFHRASDEIVMPPLPPERRRLLQRRFEQFAEGRRRPGFLQRLVASLTFDSRQQLGLAGAREAAIQAEPRQLVYSTEIADIALNIQQEAAGVFTIAGQVFPMSDEVSMDAFTIQLLQGITEFGMAMTDELGEFAFKGVSPGVYDIILSSERAEITVTSVDLTM